MFVPRAVRLPPAIGLLVLAASARAQSFNVDCGWSGQSALTPSTYGGAAGQSGTWNRYDGASPTALVDLFGQATAVTLDFVGTVENSPDAFSLGNLDWTGDDATFIDDAVELGPFGNPNPEGRMRFLGLANGTYARTTYAMSGESWVFTAVSVPGSAEGTLVADGSWPGSHVSGASHVVHHVEVTQDTIDFEFRHAALGFSYLNWNGSQPVRLGGAIVADCAGNGSDAPCPCGNSGALGRGGSNSFSASGARLVAVGSAGIAHDSVVLVATNVSNALCTLFQSDAPEAGGQGVPFDDGLDRLDGVLVRIATRTGSANSLTFPQVGETRVSVRGLLGPAGGVRWYQGFYRDAAAFCTPATLNQTNAVRIEWIP